MTKAISWRTALVPAMLVILVAGCQPPPRQLPSITHAESIAPSGGESTGDGSGGARNVLNDEPSNAEIHARIEFIQSQLDGEVTHATAWRYGWIGAFGVLTAANVVRAVAFTGSTSEAGIVATAGCILGLLSVAVLPPRIIGASSELRAYRRGTHDPPLAQLREAERLFRVSAAAQNFMRSILSQVARGIVTAGLGLTLWLVYGEPEAAGINAGAGMVVGQLMMHTHPSGASEAWERYTRAFPDTGFRPRRVVSARSTWMIVPQPQGMGVLFSF